MSKQPQTLPKKPREYLHTAEFKALSQRNNGLAARGLLINFALIGLGFAIPALWPNPLTILFGVLVLGGRQVGLAILMHDTAHKAYFSNPNLNEWVGKWLCASPIMASLEGYREYHLRHHATAGTKEDPDIVLVRQYPVSRNSMIRKFMRDAVGLTGLKVFGAVMLMYLGLARYQLSYELEWMDQSQVTWKQRLNAIFRHLHGPVLSNLALFGILYALGIGWCYWLWVAAFFTTFNVFLRIRVMAEHAVVPNLIDPDPLKNTRTTHANWLARLLWAPNFVNYHLEHHIFPGIPPYHLPRLHQILLERGALQEACLADSYWVVIRQAIRDQQQPATA